MTEFKRKICDDFGVEVPDTFTGLTASGEFYNVVKGNLNNFRARPQILNEHTESSRSLIATIDSSTIVGQIFQASEDNINGANITVLSSQSYDVDDFESYSDSAALQAAWIASNGSYLATLETTIVSEGTKSMALPGDAVVNDEWVLTVPSVSLIGYTGGLDIQQTHDYSQMKLDFFVGDGTYTASAPIVVSAANTWQRVEISESQLVDDPGGSVNRAAITKVGLRITDRRVASTFYIDDLKAAPAPGSFGMRLWDMGDTLPTSGVTSLDDGTQYTKLGDLGISGTQIAEITVDLVGGKRQYHVDDFIAGVALEMPGNEVLVPDNYYALTLNYIDTDIEVYGPDTSIGSYYTNGFSFTAPDETTAITATGANEDLQFGIFSTQDVYLINLLQIFDDVPGVNSRVLANVEQSDMSILNSVIVQGIQGIQTVDQSFLARPYFMEKGGKFEFNYNDDPDDSVSTVDIFWQYFFIPSIPNG